MERYFFCGIGGNGMSPLARLLASRGHQVFGSDRSYDQGRNLAFFEQLKSEGITLVPQDGSGVNTSISTFVITRAVEDSSADVKRAKELNLTILKRPLLMAQIFKDTNNIAVGGTSGKSTTTGMIGHILSTCGKHPTVMNGAIMLNSNCNFMDGRSDLAVFEADESDGTDDVIAVCPANIAVLTNISLDHFELDKLKQIFAGFIQNARGGAVINADCATSRQLASFNKKSVTFSVNGKADFTLTNTKVSLTIPGEHNKANALAAIASCTLLGIPKEEALCALESFKGIKRRLEVVGNTSGVRVIDDFASNPGKIEASVKTVQDAGRTFIIFQPHGFQPTKMMKQGYIDSFIQLLRKDDTLVMPDIYYAGGSVNVVDGMTVELPKDISSNDVIKPIAATGKKAFYIPERRDILPLLKSQTKAGDTVIVMGSRDETLSDFAAEIVAYLK